MGRHGRLRQAELLDQVRNPALPAAQAALNRQPGLVREAVEQRRRARLARTSAAGGAAANINRYLTKNDRRMPIMEGMPAPAMPQSKAVSGSQSAPNSTAISRSADASPSTLAEVSSNRSTMVRAAVSSTVPDANSRLHGHTW